MALFTKKIDDTARDVDHSFDAIGSDGWYSPTPSSAYSLGFPGAVTRNIGLRFTGVTIDPGSTINSAILRFTALDSRGSQTIKIRIYGVDQDNTAEFVTSPEDSARTRPHTSAFTDWNVTISTTANATFDSADITAVIQEIIDRGGWASGNAIGIWLADNGSTSGHYVNQTDYSAGDPNEATELRIDFTQPGSPSPSATPSSSPSRSPSASASPSASISPSASNSPSPSPPAPEEEYFGIKVSKPGVDVQSATSPNDFYLHSMFPLLKVHSFGTFSFAVSTGMTTINHNLGYKPFVLVFSKLVSYDYVGDALIVTSEYYQHDWAIVGASKEWWGRTEIFDNKIDIHVGQTDAFHPVTQVQGFYYIFKDETQ